MVAVSVIEIHHRPFCGYCHPQMIVCLLCSTFTICFLNVIS